MILELDSTLTLFDVLPDALYVPLGRGRLAVIDYLDADLAALGWYACGGYAAHRVGRLILMHRVIMERMLQQPIPSGLLVDHVNGDPLDNRRANLRLATPAENAQNRKQHRNNTSGYRGVSRIGDRWQARISAFGRRIHLGYHDTPQDAYRAYLDAAQTYHGRFTRLTPCNIVTLESQPQTVGQDRKVA